MKIKTVIYHKSFNEKSAFRMSEMEMALNDLPELTPIAESEVKQELISEDENEPPKAGYYFL